MVTVTVVTLGAGSEVGRSCFFVSIDDTNVLIDTGVHPSPSSESERIPRIPTDVNIHAVIISHCHLDHVGALPHLTEVARTIPPNCEIFMTSPTKTLSPSVCVDYSRGPNGNAYVANHVAECFSSDRVRVIGCGEEVRLESNPAFVVKTAHAGHVIGGVLLRLSYKAVHVVYTGDFSVQPDSLLAPIRIPNSLVSPRGTDVVISECTHATTVAPPNRSLETVEIDICKRIKRTLDRGGRVLIPLFAVGRTQEMASMIRRHLGDVRLFTTSPAGHRASILSASLHRQWLRDQVSTDSFKVHVVSDSEPFPENAVVFASPAMIEGGSSLKLFSEICGDPKNLVLLTGYCQPGTVGNSVILFASRTLRERTVLVDGRRMEVACECFYSPISNHTDSTGIVNVLRQLRPRTGLLLVHGQREKIEKFASRLRDEKIVDGATEIHIPRNYETHIFDCAGGEASDNAPSVREPQHVLMNQFVETKLSVAGIVTLVEEMIPSAVILRGSEVVIRDSRGSVEVSQGEGGIEFNWNADLSLGPEWVAFNPLVSGIIFAIQHASPVIPQEDTFSVSECSE